MKKIVVNYSPFVLQQNIFVYEEDEVIATVPATIGKINDIVIALSDYYDIYNVVLVGNQDYLAKFKAELKTTFGDSPIYIEIENK